MIVRILFTLLRYAWASPTTLLGLAAGLLTLATGGRGRRRQGVIEFHGGAVRWLLEHFPNNPVAMTLGHVIVGRTAAALDVAFDHEMVHVRQYERWGPAMPPAYLLCSLVLWLRKKDPYRDNPFEIEAYAVDGG